MDWLYYEKLYSYVLNDYYVVLSEKTREEEIKVIHR